MIFINFTYFNKKHCFSIIYESEFVQYIIYYGYNYKINSTKTLKYIFSTKLKNCISMS